MNLRAAIVVALEALEVGDQAYAVDVLLGALEGPPRVRRYRCACGSAFEWPGLLDHHTVFCTYTRRFEQAA